MTIRFRADAGFYDTDFVQRLDEQGIGYVLVAQMPGPLKARATPLRFRTFRQQGQGQVATTRSPPHGWARAHRFLLVRRPKPSRDEAAQHLTLWHFKDFFYHAFVSNLRLTPATISRFSTGRANIELDLRELNEAFPLGQVPTTCFAANAAHFELTLLADDLVHGFRRAGLTGPWQTARRQTLRDDLFMLPARLWHVGHRHVLKLPDRYPHRQRFKRVLTALRRLHVP